MIPYTRQINKQIIYLTDMLHKEVKENITYRRNRQHYNDPKEDHVVFLLIDVCCPDQYKKNQRNGKHQYITYR